MPSVRFEWSDAAGLEWKGCMKLLAAFVAGLLAGIALSGIYVLSLKATVRLYRSYIRERIDQQWDEAKKDRLPRPHAG